MMFSDPNSPFDSSSRHQESHEHYELASLCFTPRHVNHYLARSGINDYFWGHLTQHLPVICLNLD